MRKTQPKRPIRKPAAKSAPAKPPAGAAPGAVLTPPPPPPLDSSGEAPSTAALAAQMVSQQWSGGNTMDLLPQGSAPETDRGATITRSKRQSRTTHEHVEPNDLLAMNGFRQVTQLDPRYEYLSIDLTCSPNPSDENRRLQPYLKQGWEIDTNHPEHHVSPDGASRDEKQLVLRILKTRKAEMSAADYRFQSQLVGEQLVSDMKAGQFNVRSASAQRKRGSEIYEDLPTQDEYDAVIDVGNKFGTAKAEALDDDFDDD